MWLMKSEVGSRKTELKNGQCISGTNKNHVVGTKGKRGQSPPGNQSKLIDKIWSYKVAL